LCHIHGLIDILPSRDAAGKTRKRYSKFAKFITFPISENRLRSSGCGPIMNDMLKKAHAIGRANSRESLKRGGYEANEMLMRGTLLADIPVELPEEIFETICLSDNVKIERIVSRGHASATGFWYDQEKSEFIFIVQGSAGLKFENERDIVILKTGDYLNIGAHVKHRVEWTDPTCNTVWLAVHY